MRVYPVQGLVLRDPRTKRLVDPVEGVEVEKDDKEYLTFVWLLDRADASLSPPTPAPAPAAKAADKAPPAPSATAVDEPKGS